MSELSEGILDLATIAQRALDQRDAALQETAELRELAATCGAIAAEALAENRLLHAEVAQLTARVAELGAL